MRAREPDISGVVTRDGVRVAYDVYGDDNPVTIVLLPAWIIADSRLWKMQVPVLARRHRVIVVEGRGNGRSDRPVGPEAYTAAEYVADAIAVLDATGTDRAIAMGVSLGGDLVVEMATSHPDRTIGGALITPALAHVGSPLPEQRVVDFHARLDADEGWALYNEHAWRRDLPRFAEFFWSQVFTEPHSTKATEDGVAWTAGTDAATLIATELAPNSVTSRADARERLRSVRCPTLVIVGSDDAIVSADCGTTAAEVMGSDLLVVERGGHCPQARDPVRVNRSLLEFVDRVASPQGRTPVEARWTRALSRPRRVLYVSSPIGLGHARRDLAIARELGKLRDGVQIDWLAQEPVTTFLTGVGERVHPASAQLSSESQHIESEAFEHELHAFQAIRRMDEILLSNFSVFQELVDSGDYDLVVGDEAWDIDHFWHENPELKRSAYAWVTDFVGWLPMPEGGPEEVALTADYNAEMIEHVERFKRVRDRAIFIGEPDDIVPDTFGPGLPSIRALDAGPFRLRRLRQRPGPGRRRAGPPCPASEARTRPRRTAGGRDRRRLRRGPLTAGDGHERVPTTAQGDRRPADDGGGGAAGRPLAISRATRASTSGASSRTFRFTWPPVTSQSSRVG